MTGHHRPTATTQIHIHCIQQLPCLHSRYGVPNWYTVSWLSATERLTITDARHRMKISEFFFFIATLPLLAKLGTTPPPAYTTREFFPQGGCAQMLTVERGLNSLTSVSPNHFPLSTESPRQWLLLSLWRKILNKILILKHACKNINTVVMVTHTLNALMALWTFPRPSHRKASCRYDNNQDLLAGGGSNSTGDILREIS